MSRIFSCRCFPKRFKRNEKKNLKDNVIEENGHSIEKPVVEKPVVDGAPQDDNVIGENGHSIEKPDELPLDENEKRSEDILVVDLTLEDNVIGENGHSIEKPDKLPLDENEKGSEDILVVDLTLEEDENVCKDRGNGEINYVGLEGQVGSMKIEDEGGDEVTVNVVTCDNNDARNFNNPVEDGKTAEQRTYLTQVSTQGSVVVMGMPSNDDDAVRGCDEVSVITNEDSEEESDEQDVNTDEDSPKENGEKNITTNIVTNDDTGDISSDYGNEAGLPNGDDDLTDTVSPPQSSPLRILNTRINNQINQGLSIEKDVGKKMNDSVGDTTNGLQYNHAEEFTFDLSLPAEQGVGNEVIDTMQDNKVPSGPPIQNSGEDFSTDSGLPAEQGVGNEVIDTMQDNKVPSGPPIQNSGEDFSTDSDSVKKASVLSGNDNITDTEIQTRTPAKEKLEPNGTQGLPAEQGVGNEVIDTMQDNKVPSGPPIQNSGEDFSTDSGKFSNDSMVAGDQQSTDQGSSNNCTSHAIAKALYAIFNLPAQETAACINQIFKDLDGTFPHEYNVQKIQVTLPDAYNDKSISITNLKNEPGLLMLLVTKVKISDYDSRHQFVLTYISEYGHHCVYIQRKQESSFHCLNSWGNLKPEVDVSSQNVCNIYQVNGIWTPAKKLKEPTVKMLSYDNMEELAEKLDHIGCPNWKDVGMRLHDACEYKLRLKLDKHEIENLRLFYCGGGSPSLNFLLRLSVKDGACSVKKFSDIAEKLKRNDIVALIAQWKYRDDKKLEEIDDDKRKKLATYLDKKGICKDWRSFAGKFNYPYDEIKSIEKSIETGGKDSPTIKLLEIIRMKDSTFELRNLRIVLQDVGRNDVANILSNIIDSHMK